MRVTPTGVGSSKYTNVVISIVFAGTEQTIVAGEAPLFIHASPPSRLERDMFVFFEESLTRKYNDPFLRVSHQQNVENLYSFTCLGDTIFTTTGKSIGRVLHGTVGTMEQIDHSGPGTCPGTEKRGTASLWLFPGLTSLGRHLQRGNTASNEAVAFIVHDVDRGHFTTWTKVLWAWYIVSHRMRLVA